MQERNLSSRSPLDGIRVGVVNPLTLVGKEVISILAERSFPSRTIELIDTIAAEEAILTELDGTAAVVSEASDVAFADLDVVFFCGPGSKNEPWIRRQEEFGFVAIDLSRPPALPAEAVPVIAGVNDDAVGEDAALLLSPEPAVIPVALLLQRLRQNVGIELAAATVLRPASEFDQPGIDELYQQTIKVLNLQGIPTEVFDRQAAFTVYPPEEASRVENDAALQLRATLGVATPVSLQILQAGLFHGHAVSLFVLLAEERTEEEVRKALDRSESLLLTEPGEPVTTVDAAGKNEVLVGRVTRDPANGRAFWLWAAVDNLRRSSALNGVMMAEVLLERFGPKPN